jgi:hypothetical protein
VLFDDCEIYQAKIAAKIETERNHKKKKKILKRGNSRYFLTIVRSKWRKLPPRKKKLKRGNIRYFLTIVSSNRRTRRSVCVLGFPGYGIIPPDGLTAAAATHTGSRATTSPLFADFGTAAAAAPLALPAARSESMSLSLGSNPLVRGHDAFTKTSIGGFVFFIFLFLLSQHFHRTYTSRRFTEISTQAFLNMAECSLSSTLL